jgi:hypothetical protein
VTPPGGFAKIRDPGMLTRAIGPGAWAWRGSRTCRKTPALGISLHDHIIVGRQGHASFKALGLI